MKAKVFTSILDSDVAELLRDGKTGIIPCDTVYGLVAAERNSVGIEKMYTVKQRKRQPGTTIAATVEQLLEIGFPKATLDRAAKYWPDSLSVEMSTATIPEYLSVGQPVMAARIPRPQDLRDLLLKTGPLMTTSANKPDAPTATDIKGAIEYFGDDVDFYVDAGDLGDRPPSTIIGFDPNGEIIVYRQGAVKI